MTPLYTVMGGVNPAFHHSSVPGGAVSSGWEAATFVGYGSGTSGARDGSTWTEWEVTSTSGSDSGAGTLRGALSSSRSSGGTIIKFALPSTSSGVITIDADLSIITNRMTIDGSTANPGPTITVDSSAAGHEIMSILGGPLKAPRGTHDIIIYGMRFDGKIGLSTSSPNNGGMVSPTNNCSSLIIDHCTLIGSPDDVLGGWLKQNKVTISNNFIRRTFLATHWNMAGGEASTVIQSEVTFYRNVWDECSYRQPFFRNSIHHFEVINNVIHGWGWADDFGSGFQVQHVASTIGVTDLNVINNIYHNSTLTSAPDDRAIVVDAGSTANIFYSSNIFPAGELDAHSTGIESTVPTYAQVTRLPTSALSTVVTGVGMFDPSNEETTRLANISTTATS